jgi:hypothetical protein
VDSSISAIKLELSKLNSFFDHDVRAPGSSSPGILNIESTSACPPIGLAADGPARHCSKISNRNCGFGRVYPHIHDPVKGTMLPPPPPNSHLHDSAMGSDYGFHGGFRVPMGKLPKMNFPRFDGENPKLWQSHCDNYFKMYAIESCVWVRVVTMHFNGVVGSMSGLAVINTSP